MTQAAYIAFSLGRGELNCMVKILKLRHILPVILQDSPKFIPNFVAGKFALCLASCVHCSNSIQSRATLCVDMKKKGLILVLGAGRVWPILWRQIAEVGSRRHLPCLLETAAQLPKIGPVIKSRFGDATLQSPPTFQENKLRRDFDAHLD